MRLLASGVFLIGLMAFGGSGCGKTESAELAKARADHAAAEQSAIQAVKAAQEAQDMLDRIQADLVELDKRVTAAVDNVVSAQNDADRAAAKAKLEVLRKDKAELDARIAAAKAAAAKAARGGKQVPPQCIDNPLAKGCL